MRVVEASLECFRRPVVWLAIGVLLLNDFYLKGAFPSWWTGKLSDVAGLFFFPFILTAVFGLLLLPFGQTRIRAERVGRLAFILVGVWFGLMKVNPAVNELTISFWGWLVGWPVFIVMDGSDLLALPVLFPAWRLWRGQLEGRKKGVGQRSLLWDWRVWVVSGTAVFAATATSCSENHSIIRVIEIDGTIYAVSRFYDGGEFYFAQLDTELDQWIETEDVPDSAVDLAGEPVEMPLTKCVPDNPAVCYQTIGEEILESNDGGETWNIAWRVPPGREDYANRIFFLTICGSRPIFHLEDILIVGDGNDYTVLVAANNQGVLKRDSGGVWERQPVMNAEPAPFRQNSSLAIFSKTTLEFIGLLLYVFLYVVLQDSLFLHQLFYRPSKATVLIGLAVLVCSIFILSGQAGGQVFLYLCGFLLFVLLGLSIIYYAIYNLVGDRWEIKSLKKQQQAMDVLKISSILIFIFGLLSLYSWTIGVIPYYWLMMVVLVGTNLGIAAWSIRRNLMLLAESNDNRSG